MDRPRFEEVTENIQLLKIPFAGIWTGCALVRRNGRTLLIDSGADAAGVDNVILPALKEQGLEPRDIDWLLATHTHGDHVGGHARLRELGVKAIAIYEKSADKLRDPLKYNIAIRAVFPEHSAPPAKVLRGVEPDRLLADGEAVEGLRLIAAPGHDTDTVVWYDEDSGTLLTGDSIQGNGTATLGCALYMDLPAYEETLRKLAALPVRRVVAGHPFFPWGEAVIPDTRALDDSLALVAEYDERIRAQQERTLPERTAALIASLGGPQPEYLFLGMYTVREHLRRLGLA